MHLGYGIRNLVKSMHNGFHVKFVQLYKASVGAASLKSAIAYQL